ncbi:MAG: hypothetical protein JNK82_45855 [Myxococcaceae bacterium]|nr:hypothetical protein [Myxococcaceae bacterium]
MRQLSAALVALVVVACHGQDESKKRTLDKLEKSKQDKAEKQKKDADADAKRFAPKESEAVKLGSPWDDGKLITSDGPCPEGIWALFKGDAPGADKAEKKANEAKRADLVQDLKAQTFMVKLRSDGVKLKDFDAPKGEFPLEVNGSIECTDSFGHVALAWTAAKAGNPGNSAAKQDAEITQNYWLAPPVTFAIPMKSMSEAKEWANANRIGLSARVVFKLGKVEVDKKLHKVAKVTEKAAGETISIGGGTEDWGAGRLVRVELVGLRVATEKETKQIFEKKGDGS